MKVGLRLLLIGVDGSDEDGAEMGGRCGCGGRLGHSNTLVSARNSKKDPELVNVDVKSDSAQSSLDFPRLAARWTQCTASWVLLSSKIDRVDAEHS